jgi:hypothetical protein
MRPTSRRRERPIAKLKFVYDGLSEKLMKRTNVVSLTGTAEKRAPKLEPVSVPTLKPTLLLAQVHEVTANRVVLVFGKTIADAKLDPSVNPAVIEGACQRNERVLVEESEEGLVVVGALRTQPTPGIDEADSYVIKAKRVAVEGGEEVSLSTQTAAVVVRAVGEVETFAERIISRAEGVHKIIGRMLRLN